MHESSLTPLPSDHASASICSSSTSASIAHATRASLWRKLGGPVLALLVALLAFEPAEAKRMGGGKSFGSRSSQSDSYSKPVPPAKDAASPSNVQRQGATNQQGAANQGGFMSRFGGMGGMLGGLLMGGLLGSLFFGGGFGGFGMVELLLLVGVGFLVFKFLRSRRAAAAGTPSATSSRGDGLAYAGAAGAAGAGSHARTAPEHDSWGALRSGPAGSSGAGAAPAGPVLPDGMDESEFLAGAKALYVRLQSSWDKRDLADIQTFTSPEVHAELLRQAQDDPTPGVTELVLVEGRVIEVQREGAHVIISVLFDVLMREDAAAERPEQVREVWHIRRDDSAARPEWVLEGIQQLAS